MFGARKCGGHFVFNYFSCREGLLRLQVAESSGETPRHGHIELLLGRQWHLVGLPRPVGVASLMWVLRQCELRARVVPTLRAKPI